MRWIVLVLLLSMIVIPAVALAQESSETSQETAATETNEDPAGADQETTGTTSEGTANPWGDTIESVPPGEFADKVTNLIVSIRDGLGRILEPLSGLSLIVCALILVVAVFLGWHTVKRIAFGGIVLIILGLIVYWFGPLLLGVIKSIAGSL